MKSTLAIIGSHPRTRDEFDFNRDDCDIWVFNEAMSSKWAARADAVFQMHAEPIWRNPKNRNDKGHYDWLKGGDTPIVYMQAQYPDVPMSKDYLVDDVSRSLLFSLSQTVGGERREIRYFTSSVNYALALGIYKAYKKIEIYGVEMETDTEYRYQRDGVAFWIGFAGGRGIEVDFHGSIFDAPLYGYEGDVALDYEIFEQRIAELTPLAVQAQGKYEIAKAEFNAAAAMFLVTGNSFQKVSELAQVQLKAAEEFGIFDGARQENERYKGKADAMKDASGGDFIFSRQEFEQAGQAIFKERNKAVLLGNTFAGRCEVLLQDAAKTKSKDLLRTRYKAFAESYNEYVRVSTAVGMYTGALNENSAFLRTLDIAIRAAGGAKSEAVLLEALQNA
jgi:hypothetical protein